MPLAKLISANDCIEGAAVPLHGSGDIANYSWDSPDYAPHFADPTGTNLASVTNARFLAGTWALERNVKEAASGDVATPAMSGEALITYPAVTYQEHVIFGASWSYNGPTNGSGILTVEAGSGNVVFSKQIPSAASGSEDEVLFTKGLRTTRSSAMLVRLTGVAGVKGQLSVLGHRME